MKKIRLNIKSTIIIAFSCFLSNIPLSALAETVNYDNWSTNSTNSTTYQISGTKGSTLTFAYNISLKTIQTYMDWYSGIFSSDVFSISINGTEKESFSSPTTDGKTYNGTYTYTFEKEETITLGFNFTKKSESSQNSYVTISDIQVELNRPLNLTDANTIITAGTYPPNYVTYTRTGSAIVEDKYGSFCLPFDIDLSNTNCFKKVYTPIDAVLYNTKTEKLCLMFKTNDFNSTIPAGTPFIGLLNGNDVSLVNKDNIIYTGEETNPEPKQLTVFNYTGDGALWQKEDMNVSYGGTYSKTEVTSDGTYAFSSAGNFGDKEVGSFLSPFRAYINVSNVSSAKICNIELWLDTDMSTGIEDIIDNRQSDNNVDVYNITGVKVRGNQTVDAAIKGLQHGIYIINGKKISIK